MMYQKLYEKHIKEIQHQAGKADKNKKCVFGYTSNLDVLIDWDTNYFNNLMQNYLQEKPYYQDGEKISDMTDLMRVIAFFLQNHIGGEIEIIDSSVCQEILHASSYEFSLGGTAAQGSMAMSNMNFPSVLHLLDSSKEVLNFFKDSLVYTVEEDKLINVEASSTKSESLMHFIIQSQTGNMININAENIHIKHSNRIILDYDEKQRYLPLSKEFLKYVEENAEKFSSYVVSGFNGIRNEEILADILTVLNEHFEKVKQNNSEIIFYLESAHYFSSQIKQIVLKRLSGKIDIWGMNEEEMQSLFKEHSLIRGDDLETILRNLCQIKELYQLRSLIVHSKDYAIYLGQPNDNIEKALVIGNAMSTYRASSGKYCNPEQIVEVLNLPFSKTGLALATQLDKNKANLKQEDIQITFLPTKYIEKPLCTIGLGDTFTAGVQLGLFS